VPRSETFKDSPELYDAIYRFKDYARECERLQQLIEEATPGAHSILDVACGTGEHAKFLKRRYAIDGVDINERYLQAARLKNPTGYYTRADLTGFDLGRTYDVVTCLFSAIAIVRTYERLELAIKCMVRHVRPGGALIVEPWFAPDQWRPGRSFVLAGDIGAKSVYRLSNNIQEGRRSVLLHNYVLAAADHIEHYCDRIELGLFTRDEMTWAFEFAGMRVRYDVQGLMGRGLYIAQHASDILLGEAAAPTS
jgi:SAM-dependent methyltransferase